MRRLLALGFLAATALASRDANATAAVLFSASGAGQIDRHNITVTLGATGTVTWDSIDVSGSPTDIGLVVAVKSGGKVEITDPAFTSATDLATKVVVKTLPSGITCNSVGGGVDFVDSGASTSSSSGGGGKASGEGSSGCGGSGGGSGEGSGSGGGGCDDKSSTKNDKEATGGCLTSSQGGCGSCDDNGGDGCNCEPSDHGHPGCSAIHGCSSPADDDDSTTTNPQRDSGTGSSSSVGPYEETRIQSADGSAQKWLDAHGYVAPAGFLDGLKALEASGYEIHAFRARTPASPAIVKSLRVVTTSPSPTVPLRLVRMSTGADAAPTPVTLITLANGAQSLVGQTMVTIDENKIAFAAGSSNYESLVSAALGTSAPTDAGASDAGDAGDAGLVSSDTRWIAETQRAISASTTGDGGASQPQTLGDFFRQACGAPSSQTHLVCSEDVADAGTTEAPDAEADAGDAGTPASDAGVSEAGAGDGGASDAGLPADCKNVSRERCDDLSLALPAGVNIASRFRGVVGGDASLVGDLSFQTNANPLHSGVFTVRPTGEPGLCAPVNDDGTIAGSSSSSGDVSGSGSGSASCKATRRTRFRIDLGPLVTVLVVMRVLSAVMRRNRRK